MASGRYPNGKGSYAVKRANMELMATIGKMTSRISVLEEQVQTLLGGKGGVEAAVAETKNLEDLKLTELKALAAEHGIDDSQFKAKKDYFPSLKEKGLE